VDIWYKNEKKELRIKGTPYDALSLCLSQRNRENKDSFRQWKRWYE